MWRTLLIAIGGGAICLAVVSAQAPYTCRHPEAQQHKVQTQALHKACGPHRTRFAFFHPFPIKDRVVAHHHFCLVREASIFHMRGHAETGAHPKPKTIFAGGTTMARQVANTLAATPATGQSVKLPAEEAGARSGFVPHPLVADSVIISPPPGAYPYLPNHAAYCTWTKCPQRNPDS